MQRLLSGLLLVFALVLLVTNIYMEDEPGALPLLLVLVGMGWYAFAQYRTRSHLK